MTHGKFNIRNRNKKKTKNLEISSKIPSYLLTLQSVTDFILVIFHYSVTSFNPQYRLPRIPSTNSQFNLSSVTKNYNFLIVDGQKTFFSSRGLFEEMKLRRRVAYVLRLSSCRKYKLPVHSQFVMQQK